MPRRFFRKLAFKRDRLKGQWWIEPVDHLVHDPHLWGIRNRTVVPAFSLGLFIAYMPFPVSNPVTMGPMYYVAYQVGRFLLGQPPGPFEFEMSFAWLADRFATIWQPLLLGCVLLGSILALVGYIVLDLLWRASISDYLARKRRRN